MVYRIVLSSSVTCRGYIGAIFDFLKEPRKVMELKKIKRKRLKLRK